MEKSDPPAGQKSGAAMTKPGVSHEVSDVSIPDIVKFGIGLIAPSHRHPHFDVGTYRYFAARVPRPQSIGIARDRLPPEPRLQGAPGHEIHPVEELNLMRAAEESVLTTYAWVAQAEWNSPNTD